MQLQGLGKSIFITGASSGLGREMAIFLASRGHRVAVSVRDKNSFLPFPSPLSIHVVEMDVRNEEDVQMAFRNLAIYFGNNLDMLINNAGILIPGPIAEMRLEDVAQQWEVNVLGVLRVTKAFLPLLKKAGGSIVNMGSMSSRICMPFLGAYGASKAALKQITWAQRLELAMFKVKVYHLELGNFESLIWNKTYAATETLVSQDYQQQIKTMQSVMNEKRNKVNPIASLFSMLEKILHGQETRFNMVIGKDAIWRKWLFGLFSYQLLEKQIRKKLKF